ncbi:MAG: hypothetical protein HYY16_15795 [Planctomycetes bacterium]|nr:hypothetical protein [Planctomycetota bacterium]
MNHRNAWAVLILCAAFPASAAAQNFGQEWIDRVTHELEQEGPLTAKPVKLQGFAGLAYFFDDNVFLDEDSAESDSIIVPWVRGRVDYSEPNFDAVADLLLNYKAYTSEDDESADEERFFGRARYEGAKFRAEIGEILRRESDPVDVIFVDRVDRIVSGTFPRLSYDVTNTVSAELASEIQFVSFDDDAFSAADNVTVRVELGGVYRMWEDTELLLQLGLLMIDFDDAASVDSQGWYFRGGFRGPAMERLYVDAYAGVTGIESDEFPGTSDAASHDTMDLGLYARYEASPNLRLNGDYARRFAFGVGTDPFQVIDRFLVLAEYDVTPEIVARGRLQFEHAHTAMGNTRDYMSLGLGATYRITSEVVAEGGLTWRQGDRGSSGGDFDNVIFNLGAAVSF